MEQKKRIGYKDDDVIWVTPDDRAAAHKKYLGVEVHNATCIDCGGREIAYKMVEDLLITDWCICEKCHRQYHKEALAKGEACQVCLKQ